MHHRRPPNAENTEYINISNLFIDLQCAALIPSRPLLDYRRLAPSQNELAYPHYKNTLLTSRDPDFFFTSPRPQVPCQSIPTGVVNLTLILLPSRCSVDSSRSAARSRHHRVTPPPHFYTTCRATARYKDLAPRKPFASNNKGSRRRDATRRLQPNLHPESSVTFSSHGSSDAVCIPNTEGDWHRGCRA